MPRRQQNPDPDYPAEKARQGDIVLRTRPERAIFIAGIVAAFVIALLLIVFWPR
jgi:hypothetical protein